MAEFDSRQYTNSVATPRVKNAPYDSGRVSVEIATTPATAAWAQNDTFNTGIVLLKGTRILRSGMVNHGVFGAGVTMDIGLRAASDGTVIDADGLAAALDVAAAGVKEIHGGALLVANGYITTQDVEVYATLGGANPTDNIQAEFEIHFIAPTP